MNETERQIQRRIEELKLIIAEKKKALQTAPEGGMRASCRKNNVLCYWRKPGNEKETYIHDLDLIRRLSQKDYDQRVLRAAQNELELLEHTIRKYPSKVPENVYDSMGRAKKRYSTPIYLPDDQYQQRWLSAKFTPKGFSDNNTEFYTTKGERMRSKSEVMIAERYSSREILYRYECPLRLQGFGIIYPDFRILNIRTRKEYIHEHFGMMDDQDYADHAVRKINAYIRCGIFPGNQLITTFETKNQPLSMKTIDEIIDHYYV